MTSPEMTNSVMTVIIIVNTIAVAILTNNIITIRLVLHLTTRLPPLCSTGFYSTSPSFS